jgi:hypothetical protein
MQRIGQIYKLNREALFDQASMRLAAVFYSALQRVIDFCVDKPRF